MVSTSTKLKESYGKTNHQIMETNEENVRRALSTTKLQAVAVFEVLQL